MKRILLLQLVCLLSGATNAAVLIARPHDGSGILIPSSWFAPNGLDSDTYAYDTFVVTNPGTSTEINWQGGGGANLKFTVTLYDPAHPYGNPQVHGPSYRTFDVGTNFTQTLLGTFNGTPVYDFKFIFPTPVQLMAGTNYSLLIEDYSGTWGGIARGGNGTHIEFYTGLAMFLNAPGDTAFTFTGPDVPLAMITTTVAPVGAGTIAGGGTYTNGDAVTLVAQPGGGRTFLKWTEAGTVVSTNASYTFTASGDRTLTANFSASTMGPFVVSAVANPAVYGTVGGAGTVAAGDILDLDVTPADGLSFIGWTENGAPVTFPFSGGVFQVTAASDRNLVANFAYPGDFNYINGVVAPANTGTIFISNTAGLSSGNFQSGTMLTLTATPAPGYHFVSWKQGAGLGDLSGAPHLVSSNAVLNHLVCYATTLTANFLPDFPVLSLSTSPAGSGTLIGAGAYPNGTIVSVNATPAIGYVFMNWTAGASVVSTNASLDFVLTNHYALTANFVATSRTILATAEPLTAGSVSGDGVVGNAATVTLTASPAPGYLFDRWTVAGLTVATNNPLSFVATADRAFVAHFLVDPAPPLSPPRLEMLLTGSNTVVLSWPAGASGFVLQQTPDFATSNWSEVTNNVSLSGTNNQVILAAPASRGFYRLKSP